MNPSIITFEFDNLLYEDWEDFKKHYQSTYHELCRYTSFSVNNKSSFEKGFEKKTIELLRANSNLFNYKVDLSKAITVDCSPSLVDKRIVLKIKMISVEYTVIDTVLRSGSLDNSHYTIQDLLIVEGDQSENLKKGKMYEGEIKTLSHYKVITYKPII